VSAPLSAWSALLNAVRDRLRTDTGSGGLGYTAANCARTPDGRPAPRAGKVFVAVHKGGRTQDAIESLEEEYAVLVTVTVRVDGPWDRIGSLQLEKATEGLDDRIDAIRADLTRHQYAVMNAANTSLNAVETVEDGTRNGFVEPLWFLGESTDQLVGSDWFHGAPADKDVGVAATLRFGKARMIQPIPEAV
jgi:hypothetical protein